MVLFSKTLRSALCSSIVLAFGADWFHVKADPYKSQRSKTKYCYLIELQYQFVIEEHNIRFTVCVNRQIPVRKGYSMVMKKRTEVSYVNSTVPQNMIYQNVTNSSCIRCCHLEKTGFFLTEKKGTTIKFQKNMMRKYFIPKIGKLPCPQNIKKT